MNSDVDFISRSIRNHLEDLHILMTCDQVNIDIPYYNEVTLALLAAEDALEKAKDTHQVRLDRFCRANMYRTTVD